MRVVRRSEIEVFAVCVLVMPLVLWTRLTGADSLEPMISVATLNAEWLWTPHDGSADGTKFNKGDMSPTSYRKEIEFYASIAKASNVDLIALSEIENELVVSDLAYALGNDWQGYFVQGRDTATGQDVGIVTRLEVIQGSITNFNFPCGKVNGLRKRKCLSKVLGLTVMVMNEDINRRIHVVTSHFLSRRNGSKLKDLKRQSQSLAVLKALDGVVKVKEDAVIVLGDFNDTLGSTTLRLLMEEGDLHNSIQCDPLSAGDNRIDHILYRGVTCRSDQVIDMKGYSDHPLVLARFSLY